MIEPTTAQIQAMKAIDDQKQSKALVVLPTGSGKTYLAAFHSKNRKAKRILYVAHRNELVEQARRVFKEIHHRDDNSLGVVNAYRKDFHRDFIFATIQTLVRKRNLEMIQDIEFDYVIIDEFHHAASDSYQKLIPFLRFKFMLGLTATPYRGDERDIFSIVEDNIPFEMNVAEGIKRKILCPFVYLGYYDQTDYKSIEKKNGQWYTEKDLDKKLVVPKRDLEIFKAYMKSCKNRQALGFCVSRRHCYRIANFFNEMGIPAVGLTDRDKYSKRKHIIEDFRKGYYKVIFTRDIFNEGVDFPNVSALLFLRPTNSKVVFFQQLGRGLRLAPEKRETIILDFIGNYNKAWYKREWLRKFPLRPEETIPEEFVFDGNIHVYFQKEVIDLFKHQQLGNDPISKDMLIKIYYETKRKLGRQPTAKEMHRYSGIWWTLYRYHFGSWNGFLEAINEPLLMKYRRELNEDKLIENYKKVKTNIKRQPVSHKDLRKKHGSEFSIRDYQKVFGSWSNFLKKIGEPMMRKKRRK